MLNLSAVFWGLPHKVSYDETRRIYSIRPITDVDRNRLQTTDAQERPWVSRRKFCYRSEYNHRAESYLWCNPAAMKNLAPLLDDQANGVLVIQDDAGEILGYHFKPATVHYSTDYPNYAQIAAERPEHIHYFFKFPQQNYIQDKFFLVTEAFVNTVHENHIAGAVFSLKWDGKLVGVKCQD